MNNLIENLILYSDIQDLRKMQLTEEEIQGYLEFEWDAVQADSILFYPRRIKNDN
jgi:hypothetical protein